MIFQGSIRKDGAQIFRLPVPPSLSGERLARSMRVTLAWFSPVNPSRAHYRFAPSREHPLSAGLPVNELGARRRRSEWLGKCWVLAPDVLGDAGVPGAGVFGLLAAEG